MERDQNVDKKKRDANYMHAQELQWKLKSKADFVAYLDALEALGRPAAPEAVRRRGLATAVEAMRHVDLLVVLPLSTTDHVGVSEEEDPELRTAMDAALLDLVDDPVVVAETRVLEVSGTPEKRLTQLVAAAAG